MATTGIVPGTLMAVYVSGTKIALLTTNSFSESRPTRETANKDSGDWVTRVANRGSWSASASALYQNSASNGNYHALKALKDAGASVTVMFHTMVSGDYYFTGSALITELSLDFPDNDNSSYSISFEGTGALTENTYT